MKRLLDQLSANERSTHELSLRLLTDAGLTSYKSLSGALEDPTLEEGVRLAACWALGKLGGARGVSSLLRALSRGEPTLAFEAAKALIKPGVKDAVKRLCRIVRSGAESHNRAAAVYTLGMLGDCGAVRTLLEVIKGKDAADVRGHAAEALGYIGDRTALQTLLQALRDESGEVRFWSAFALGQIGDPRAIPALRELASSDKTVLPGWGGIRQEARKAIRRLDSRGSARLR